MKTAKEWVQSFPDTMEFGAVLKWAEDMRLEAWKRGMTDATMVAESEESEANPFPTRLKLAILRARDDKQSL